MMNLDKNQSDRGMQIYQEIKKAMMPKINNDVTIFYDIAYDEGKVCEITILKEEHCYEITKHNVPNTIISNYIGGKETKALFLIWLKQERSLLASPKLHKIAYQAVEKHSNPDGFFFVKNSQAERDAEGDALKDLLNDDFDMEKDLEGLHEKAQKNVNNIDASLETGVFKVFLNIPADRKNNNDLIDRMFDEIYEDYDNVLKKYVALYTYENMYGKAKPTLILTGDRGVGKGILADRIMSSIYPGASMPLPPNWDSFTGFLTNKLVIADETTSKGVDLSAVYDFIKKISGAVNIPIKIENKQTFSLKSGTFIVLISNEKPLHIKDEILDEANNQFLAVRVSAMNKKLGLSKPAIINSIKDEMQKRGYIDFADFLADSMGHYIRTTLLDWYKQTKKEQKNPKTRGRYGMLIPITRELERIQSQSTTNAEDLIQVMCSDLYNEEFSDYNFTKTDEDDIVYFHQQGRETGEAPLSSKVLNKMLNISRNTSISGKYARNYFEDRGVLLNRGKPVRIKSGLKSNVKNCILLDYEMFITNIVGDINFSVEAIKKEMDQSIV